MEAEQGEEQGEARGAIAEQQPDGRRASNATVSHVSARHKVRLQQQPAERLLVLAARQRLGHRRAIQPWRGRVRASPRRAMSLWMAEAAYMHESMTTGPSEAMSTRAGSLPNALYRMSAAQIAPMAKD